MYKNAGFTLIELLVVVLIIGILAAVAVPQYQTAVDKSRFSSLLHILKAVRQAEEVYYLANGHYTCDADSLDVDLPGEFGRSSADTGGAAPCGRWYYSGDGKSRLNIAVDSGGPPRIYVFDSRLPAFPLFFFAETSSYGGMILCGVDKKLPSADVEKGKRLCAALGGVPGLDNSAYFYYRLN